MDISQHCVIQSVTDDVRDNINYLELLPLLLAARRWGHMWKNTHIILYTDNMSTVSFVNRGSSRCESAMDWLRELSLMAVEFNFHVTANVIGDALSRLNEVGQWPLFYQNTFSLSSNMDHFDIIQQIMILV